MVDILLKCALSLIVTSGMFLLVACILSPLVIRPVCTLEDIPAEVEQPTSSHGLMHSPAGEEGVR
jgi:hypothetical protein